MDDQWKMQPDQQYHGIIIGMKKKTAKEEWPSDGFELMSPVVYKLLWPKGATPKPLLTRATIEVDSTFLYQKCF